MKTNVSTQTSLTAVQRYATPLRYPGGKAVFFPLLKSILEKNKLVGCDYFEPFAGGAGVAFMLLRSGLVSKIHLNDADPRIYAFWNVVFNQNKKLARRIRNAELTINEWRKQYKICAALKGYSEFEIAFSAFYMNRCNRSGVIMGSRPIGGMSQDGPYLMDVRFNREVLAARIEALAAFECDVRLYNLDALTLLKKEIPRGPARKKVFVYLDPPYFDKGRRLYLNYYTPEDHKLLSRYMKEQKNLRWMISYDDVPNITDLYGSLVRRNIDVKYSMQVARNGKELLIAPDLLKFG